MESDYKKVCNPHMEDKNNMVMVQKIFKDVEDQAFTSKHNPYMEDKNNMAMVQKIFTDVKDKAFLSKHCYKTQIDSYKNLLKELKTVNVKYKLQSEAINNANERINNNITNSNSLLTIEKTLKKGNFELIYRLFLEKEATVATTLMENNLKIYNEHWLQSKEKSESLQFVKPWLKKQVIKKKLPSDIQLQNERIILLKKSIRSKALVIEKTEQRKVLQFAQFMIQERPKSLDLIKVTKRKSSELNVIIGKLKEKHASYFFVYSNKQSTSDIVSRMQEYKSKHFELSTTPIVMKKYNDELSKLITSIPEVDVEPEMQNPFTNTVTFAKSETKKSTKDEWSNYFAFQYFLNPKQNIPIDVPNEKQIYLIDNKNVNEKEAQAILLSVNPNTLKSVTSIGFNSTKTKVPVDGPTLCQLVETENISIPMELNEMSEPVDQQFITPPAQFIGQTLSQNEENMSQQEKITDNMAPKSANANLTEKLKKSDNRKRVAFNVPQEQEPDIVGQESFMPLNSDTGENMMRTDHSKKYKLDTSLQFTYAKNNLRKRTNDEYVKSKFFSDFESLHKENVEEGIECEKEVNEHNIINDLNEKKDEPMNVHNETEQTQATGNFSGQQLPSYRKDCSESFDVTFNTITTDDGHEYQPHIDASLLLSPKSDVIEDNEMHNTEQMSSFLSGIKMKGLSFFANAGSKSNSTSDQNVQNEDDFKFDFGKNKTKGGFFNIFQ